jgi:predicted transcriptional regulator YheO
MIQGLVELFHPFMEVAVHDLTKGEIVAIYNNISQRNVGDASPIQELNIKTKDFPDYFDPYYKKNWDGRALKCTTITLRESTAKAIGIICFNVDVSFAQESQRLLGLFLKPKQAGENPVELYGNECEEQVSLLITQYLNDKKLTLSRITNKQKQDLVHYLYQKGLFNFKNAAPSVAEQLNVSRATVYNYIKKIGAQS